MVTMLASVEVKLLKLWAGYLLKLARTYTSTLLFESICELSIDTLSNSNCAWLILRQAIATSSINSFFILSPFESFGVVELSRIRFITVLTKLMFLIRGSRQNLSFIRQSLPGNLESYKELKICTGLITGFIRFRNDHSLSPR